MEAVRENLFCIIQFHLNFELFAAYSSRKPVVTDAFLAVTSSVSTIHSSKSRFCQHPTNVKLKSVNCSNCFMVVNTLLALPAAVSDMVGFSLPIH